MKFYKNLISMVLAAAMIMSAFSSVEVEAAKKKKAKNYGTGTLRIFSTTDLHGQATCYSYDSASYHYNGSLAQIMTVVNQEKKNLKHGATLLVDSGDIMSGMGAEAIEKGYLSGKQYMFECLKKLNYDAITLGNHDFDFGAQYLEKALKQSKLNKKVVLSNVYYAKNKKRPWAAHKIIKKKIKTTKGKKRTVKIGIIGVTIPHLSTVCRWKDYLTTQDIYNSVDEQADELKEAGADIVVVLSHSGIGDEEPCDEKPANASYSLTEIENVDVVCAGHEHLPFPSNDERVQQYYSYKGINKKTGLANKRIITESLDKGCSFGISDLKLSFKGKKVKIVSKSTRQRYITAADKENKKVVEIAGKFDSSLRDVHDESMAHTSTEIENYFGMIEDNPLIQLSNEAKMYYGKKLIEQGNLEQYKDCPVIAGTVYKKTGASGGDDYIDSGKDIRYKDVLAMQNYSKMFTKTHYITGAQLKEWLEWQAASVFETPEQAQNDTWKDANINGYRDEGMVPVLNPQWENWSNFMVFDGIEYTIDPTELPRYSKSGLKKLNDSHRIKSLTCNGKEVRDNQIFVLVSGGVTKSVAPPIGNEVANQLIDRNVKHLSDVIEEYINVLDEAGDIMTGADSNWKLKYPEGENYVVKSSQKAIGIAETKPWFREVLGESNGYAYYRIAYEKNQKDTSGPLLITVPAESVTTGDPYDIIIQASDVSGISTIKAVSGRAESDDTAWNNAKTVNGNRYTVSENGIYSFMAVDRQGNRSIKYIKIDNIDPTVSKAPKVDDAVNNTDKSVKGIADANATVYVSCKAGSFSTTAGEDGKYECEVSRLMANESISVWQKDEKDRSSSKTKVKVQRAGANMPTVDRITNKKSAITGKLNDSGYCKVVAIVGDYIYIPKGQKKNFKNTTIYKKNQDKDIIPTAYKLKKSNKFTLKIDKMYADQKVTVYSYDWLQRASKAGNYTVAEVAPNMPVVRKVIAQEGMVYGKVSGDSGKECKIKVKVGKKKYKGKTDANGEFAIKTGSIKIGKEVSVVASDTTEAGKVRESRKNTVKAADFFKQDRYRKSDGYIDDVMRNQTKITGNITLDEGSNDKVSLIIGGSRHSIKIKKDGDFKYKMKEKKQPGTYIGILIRSKTGEIKTVNYIKVKSESS